MTSPLSRPERIAALHAAAKERILVLDGSWGVMIQRRGLEEADFRGDRFVAANGYDEKDQMKGNNDILCITRRDIIADLHDQYYGAGQPGAFQIDVPDGLGVQFVVVLGDDGGREGVGLADVGARGVILVVQVGDDVGAGDAVSYTHLTLPTILLV